MSISVTDATDIKTNKPPVQFDYIENIYNDVDIPSQPLHIQSGHTPIRHPKSHRTVGNCQATISCPFEYIDTSSMCIVSKECEKIETKSDHLLQAIRESLEVIKKKKDGK
jgi:hypothetical protein